MKSKIKVFQEKTATLLAEKINGNKQIFFATQVFQVDNRGWIAFAYYKD